MDAVVQFAIIASATITATAATYCGAVARSFANTVSDNETRSKANRAVLIASGEYDPMLDGLEAVEEGS